MDTDQLQEYIEELQTSTEEVQSPTTSTKDTTLSNTSLVSIPFTCGCSCLLNGKPCSSLFTQEYYESMRDCCVKMTKAELDNLLLGQIMAFTSTDEKTKCVSYHTTKQREKVNFQYYHAGHKVCWKTFTYLHGIGKQYTLLQHNDNTSPPSHTGKDRLGNIHQHYLCNGLVPHQHKGAGKRAHNCLSFVDIRLILNFLVNYYNTKELEFVCSVQRLATFIRLFYC